MARLIFISIFTLVLLWSGLQPKDQFTWFLEVLPALIGAVVLFKSYKTFPLTPLLYILILLHSIVLMIGGHYTYAEVPFFENLWGAERNNYDKVGHFFQGFVPALIARELLLRCQVVLKKGWLNIIIIAICLAISAFYELIEWWVALATGEGAEAFLGTQGYVWDTQSDMAWALIGAITSVIVLARWHDQQLNRLMR
jgi:putative membrane protein